MNYFGTAAIITITIGIKLTVMTKRKNINKLLQEEIKKCLLSLWNVYWSAVFNLDRAPGSWEENCNYILGSKIFSVDTVILKETQQ